MRRFEQQLLAGPVQPVVVPDWRKRKPPRKREWLGYAHCAACNVWTTRRTSGGPFVCWNCLKRVEA